MIGISIGELVIIYFTVYVVTLNYGYYLTLPWYSATKQLKTGMSFNAQWYHRSRTGNTLMKSVSMGFLIMSLILGFFMLVLPVVEFEYIPTNMSIHHDIVQNTTVVIADGTVHKVNYFEEGWYLVANKNAVKFVKRRPLSTNLYSTSMEMKIKIPPPEAL